MHTLRTVSDTCIPAQTCWSNSVLVTKRPGCVAKYRNTALVRGRSGMACSPRHRRAWVVSSRKGPKVRWCSWVIGSPFTAECTFYTRYRQHGDTAQGVFGTACRATLPLVGAVVSK